MRGKIRHLGELRQLPADKPFLFRDCLPAPGGIACYFCHTGLIELVEYQMVGTSRLALWQMTDAGKRIAGAGQ